MSDLIDRDALLQDMTHRGLLGIGDWHIFDVINEQPTIDAQPVKRGHWVLTRDENYEYCQCSECGYDTGENWMIGSEIPYCAQCGSKNYDIDANIEDSITISECIERLDAIRDDIVPNSRDYFALSAGIAALHKIENGGADDA